MEGLLGGLWELTKEFDEVVSSPVAFKEQSNVRYEHNKHRALKCPPITDKKEPRTFGDGDATRKRWCQRRHGRGVVESEGARRKEEKKYLFSAWCRGFASWNKNYVQIEKRRRRMRSMFIFMLFHDGTPSSFQREFENSSNQCPSYSGLTRGSHALLITPLTLAPEDPLV